MCFAMHFSLRQNPLWFMGNWNHVFLVSLYFKAPKCYFVELFQCPKSSSKMFFLEIEVNIVPRKNNPQTLRTRFGLRLQVLKFAEDIQFSQLDVTSTRRIPKIWSVRPVGKPAITFGVCHKEFTFIPLRKFCLGSHFAHKTNNSEFIFLFKHSIFWVLLDNVWKDVLEEMPILLWNLKPDYKMFLLYSAQYTNSKFGYYSETREILKTSYVPQSSPKAFTFPACPLLSMPSLSPLTLCHLLSHKRVVTGPPPSTH